MSGRQGAWDPVSENAGAGRTAVDVAGVDVGKSRDTFCGLWMDRVDGAQEHTGVSGVESADAEMPELLESIKCEDPGFSTRLGSK